MSSLDAYMILSGLCDMGYLSLAILLMCLYEVCLIYLKNCDFYFTNRSNEEEEKCNSFRDTLSSVAQM